MGQEQASATRGALWRRRIKIGAGIAAFAWLLVCFFVVRAEVRSSLEARFHGDVHVAWAFLWPTLDVTAYGVSIESENHRLEADRVGIDVRLLGLFGGRSVRAVDVDGFDLALASGKPLHLFRDDAAEGRPATDEADLDPVALPLLRFRRPCVRLDADAPVFASDRVVVRQSGPSTFVVETAGGGLAHVPFERLTARVIPRDGHLLVADLKMRTFNGIVGGVLDIHTARAGAFNGELEWHFVEAEQVWSTYGLAYAEKRRGDFSGEVVFRGERPELAALVGSGSLRMRRAGFFSPLSFKVFLTLKIPVAAEAPLTAADLRFSFEESLFYLESARAQARNFELEGRGILSFAGAADLEIEHAGTTVAVSGRIDDPTIKVLPLSHVTLPFDRLFRERVRK